MDALIGRSEFPGSKKKVNGFVVAKKVGMWAAKNRMTAPMTKDDEKRLDLEQRCHIVEAEIQPNTIVIN